MNREGLFWVCTSRDLNAAYLNKTHAYNRGMTKVADGLTYDEATAVILSMGYKPDGYRYNKDSVCNSEKFIKEVV